jgi:hypothetical protein
MASRRITFEIYVQYKSDPIADKLQLEKIGFGKRFDLAILTTVHKQPT